MMPVFVDKHLVAEVDPGSTRSVITAVRRCTVDGYGVRPVDHFFDGSGRVHCIVEAPDEAAVQRDQGTKDAPLLTSWRACNDGSVEGRYVNG